jgi:hypothetical protein
LPPPSWSRRDLLVRARHLPLEWRITVSLLTARIMPRKVHRIEMDSDGSGDVAKKCVDSI